MVIASLFIRLFPKVLPKKVSQVQMQIIEEEKSHNVEEDTPLRGESIIYDEVPVPDDTDTFFVALKRLLTNKLIMFNTIGAVFYILGSSVFMTYFSKYMEVQFNKSSAESALLTGPSTIFSMVSGFLISGYVISKYQPSPKKLLFYNVLVGLAYMASLFSNLFLYCESGSFITDTGLVNLTTSCNMDCSCTGVPYSPVCDEASGTTFFSPCHAGCKGWSDAERKYTDCACVKNFTSSPWSLSTNTLRPDGDEVHERLGESTSGTTFGKHATTEHYVVDDEMIFEHDETDTNFRQASREKRNAENPNLSIIPGACLAGCGYMFLTYSIISCFVNWLGSSARIGNMLVSFR